MGARRTALVAGGSLLAVLALALLAGGAGLVWAHTTQRDDGWYATSADRLATETFAITSDDIELGGRQRGEWLGWRDWADGRVRAELDDGEPVFVGIGPEADVERYLADTAHDELVDVDSWTDDVTLRRSPGDAPPAPPTSQTFWDSSATGAGRQELRWDPEPGSWMVVVMRADGAAGVDATLDAGLRTGVLLPIGLGMLVAALVLGGLGALLVARGTGSGQAPAVASPTGAAPTTLEAELDEPLSRWLWLVKWLLALPHLVAVALLWPVVIVLTVLAGFWILFTGRYPRSLFDFNVGVMRWTWRVTAYAFVLTTDRYPPFSLRAEPEYPAHLDVAYPAHLSRGLVLVKWWLLAIPHYLVLALIGGWLWEGDPAPWGVAGLLAVVAGIVLLATGAYPRPVFDVVVGLHRWVWRVAAYALLLRDEYPPFRLDTGGSEPPPHGEEGDHAQPSDDRGAPLAA